jgi:beta-galactosidase
MTLFNMITSTSNAARSLRELALSAGVSLLTLFSSEVGLAGTSNDDIFPPAPAAAKAINFDGRGFLINGQRTFITSGSVHYARVPRENWRDILLKLKRSGFNTVETYVFWSYHEAHEGQFDFKTDSRDLGAFLDTAKELGLYAIIRVGPYSCSEWENGGFPNWLYFKPGLEVRRDNPVYYRYLDAWFNQMLPIISSRQIHKGGSVILVQLENELPTDGWKYWGTEMDGRYYQHLLDLAHTNGLEVPMFFSGLHHAHDPAPDVPVDSLKRTSPWMSTELWTIWFDRYGENDQDLMKGERSAWRVLAEGGNGFNLYMFYGGTTFGYFNFNEDQKFGDNREKGTACYDFGTLIGQAGETRTLYRRLKRLAYFAESFPQILANSTNSTDHYQGFANGPMVTARTAPGGTLVFLDNAVRTNVLIKGKAIVKVVPGAEINVLMKSGISIRLAAGEIVGLPIDVPLAPGLTMAEADTRILGIVLQGGITSIICYGDPGETGKISFKTDTVVKAETIHDAGFKFDPENSPSLTFRFPEHGVGEEFLGSGTNRFRVLVMNKDTADQTWFVDTVAGRQVVVGAPYLGKFATSSGKFQASVNYPWTEATPTSLTIYGDGVSRQIDLSVPTPPNTSESLKLAAWRMSSDSAALSRQFEDDSWFALPDGSPPEMGEDGDYSPFAWYRTKVTNSTPIKSLAFKRIGDRATFFVDGKMTDSYDFKQDREPVVAVNFPPGAHELAVFVAHAGRRKFAGYTGSIHRLESQKGLRGPVFADGTNMVLFHWRMHGGANPANQNLKWSSVATNGAPAFYRTSFHLDTLPESAAVYRFHTDGLSFGSIWLNGHNLGRYPEIVKGCPGLWLPDCWLTNGANTLTIYDERGYPPGKTCVKLEVAASQHCVSLGTEGKP